MVWRKHWFILVAKLTAPLLVFFLMVVLVFAGVAGIWFLENPENFGWFRGLILGIEVPAILGALACLAWVAWIVADWHNDTYTVTNDRIIDTEQKPLFFAETRLEAMLGEIQDIQFDIPDPLHALLDFGNVRIQTAAQHGTFTFDQVPDPRAVADEIRRRVEEWRRNDERRKAQERARELPDWFEMYDRLRSGQASNQ